MAYNQRQRSDEMQMKFCKCCNVSLNAVIYGEHVRGKKHLNNQYRYTRELRRAEKSICVFGQTDRNTRNELAHYFGNFGTVTGVDPDPTGSGCVVSFANQVSVEQVLQQSDHFLDPERRLDVQRKKPNMSLVKKSKRPAELPKEHGIICRHLAQLHSAANVEEQVDMLTSQVLLGEKDIQDRVELCSIIEKVFLWFYPKCKVVPFGSSVNGLGIAGCDLDMYLDLDPCRSDKSLESVSGSVQFSELRSSLKYVQASADPQYIKSLTQLDDKETVVIMAQVLQRFVQGCDRVVPIPYARCPLVSFHFAQFNIDCDMQTRYRLGVHNSVLIKVIQQLDRRVQQMMVAVRLWAKQHYLTDSKNGRFSSYALAMITVFYLQSCQPPVLPPLDTLQQLADKTVMYGDFKISFCMDPTKVPKSDNQSDFESLFRGFFPFFAKMNHKANVFSPNTGKCIPRAEFDDMITNDKAITGYKLSRINLQDPFELNRNITSGVIDCGCVMWFEALDAACALLDSDAWKLKTPTSDADDNNGEQVAWGFQALLTNSVSLDERLVSSRTRAEIEVRKRKMANAPDPDDIPDTYVPRVKEVEVEGFTVIRSSSKSGTTASTTKNTTPNPLPVVSAATLAAEVATLKPLAAIKIKLDLYTADRVAEELELVSAVVHDILETGLKFSRRDLQPTSDAEDVVSSTNHLKTKRTAPVDAASESGDETPCKFVKLDDGTSSPSEATNAAPEVVQQEAATPMEQEVVDSTEPKIGTTVEPNENASAGSEAGVASKDQVPEVGTAVEPPNENTSAGSETAASKEQVPEIGTSMEPDANSSTDPEVVTPASHGKSSNDDLPTAEEDQFRKVVYEGSSKIYKLRKSARSKIPLQVALSDTLAVESSVSEVILTTPPIEDVQFRFVASVSPVAEGPLTRLVVHLWNLVPAVKEFDGPFAQFLNAFLPKIVALVVQEKQKTTVTAEVTEAIEQTKII